MFKCNTMSRMSKLFMPLVRKSVLFKELISIWSVQNIKYPLFLGKDLLHPKAGSRYMSTELQQQKNDDKSLTESKCGGEIQTSFKTTVKENTKTASYLGVILIGISVTGIIFFAIFRELFSNNSPNSIYSQALERVCSDTKIQDAIGTPISGYGEETRRGRRRHVSHLSYEKHGVKYIRMKFYISGSRKRGTVHLEMKEDERGNFIYRYLFVELDDFGRHAMVLEDNRETKSNFSKGDLDLTQPLPSSQL